MNDPKNLIQKNLDKIYSHLLYHIENEFVRLFGKVSPSVTGIDEAIKGSKWRGILVSYILFAIKKNA